MEDGGVELRRIRWGECFSFPHLFRAFQISLHPTKVLLALAAVISIYMVGRVLDGIWPASSSPIVVKEPAGTNELDFYLRTGGDSKLIEAWQKELTGGDGSRYTSVGPFSLLLQRTRFLANQAIDGVLSLRPQAVVGAVVGVAQTKMWLVRMHPLYAALFGLACVAIWAYLGGALCRMIALHATRDERLGLREALAFAREKFLAFFLAQLFPLAIVAGAGFLLLLAGLVGCIPALDVLVGVFFFLAILAGCAMAFVIVGTAAGGFLMFPTIAVERSDPFDAVSRALGYVYERPWRLTLYASLSLLYGALCIAFVKLFIRVSLVCTHAAIGLGMNVADTNVKNSGTTVETPKLDAIWQAPSMTFDTPFYGVFSDQSLSGTAGASRFFIKSWVYLLWAVVAAFAICLFYSSSTLIYLLLRRDVDATDLEEIFLEDFDAEPYPAPAGGASAPPPAASGGTSLPIMGQDPRPGS